LIAADDFHHLNSKDNDKGLKKTVKEFLMGHPAGRKTFFCKDSSGAL
jgi:hypothetical protein|tara:strand:- start:158 stop:298 length:141 start_codon:yes stop_codon:yes gene_type:complete